jgi:hypothetical protein
MNLWVFGNEGLVLDVEALVLRVGLGKHHDRIELPSFQLLFNFTVVAIPDV